MFSNTDFCYILYVTNRLHFNWTKNSVRIEKINITNFMFHLSQNFIIYYCI